MSEIVAYRDRVIAGLAAILRTHRVESYGGRFEIDDLVKASINPPCVLVGVASLDAVVGPEDEACGLTTTMAAVVAEQRRPAKDASSAGLAAAQTIAISVYAGQFTTAGAYVDTSSDIFAELIHDGVKPQTGIVLWGVMWRATIRVPVPRPVTDPRFGA